MHRTLSTHVRRTRATSIAAFAALVLLPVVGRAQLSIAPVRMAPSAASTQGNHATLHVDPRWKECSFKLDASLTQEAWRQFTREAGLVTYFRPLIDAKPMGRGKVELSVLQWEAAIDDHDAAWNDTFVHPDSAHWLFEGEGLRFPGLMVRAGVSRRVDVGAYFTKNPGANYGFYGGQVQFNVVDDTTRNWAVSTRASAVRLFGPDDIAFSVGGIDAIVSRQYRPATWATISPYVGVSTYVSHAHEKSALVNLADETTPGAQASAGLSLKLSVVRIAAEYNTARVRSRSLKIGIGL